MSAITLTKESHKKPSKFRIQYSDGLAVLGPEHTAQKNINDNLPIATTSSQVAVIGAGFGGIGAAIKTMDDLHVQDVTIFEKHDNFGGTWYANTYPGCASDIPALWYSYSFMLNTNWSRAQPPQYEMEEYILRVTDHYRLKEKTRFQTSVDRCVYDEDTGVWTLFAHDVKTGQRIEHTANIVLSCGGILVNPHQLNAPGLENFKGKYIHSAVWDHSIDFRGKDVLVVGNGCSANQVVPALLNDPQYKVGSITQIARSKHYIMPPIPAFLMFINRLFSFSFYGLMFVRLITVWLSELRFPLFKKDGFISEKMRSVSRAVSIKYIKKNAPEKYWDLLIPEYKFGCKPDIIVACTGYDVLQALKLPFSTTKGYNSQQIWEKEGISTYRTILVKHMPNLFFIGGPNTITGHSSVVMAIENAVDYYLKLVKPVIEGREKAVVVKPEAYDKWHKEIQEESNKSVFGTKFGGCVSWYSDSKENAITFAWSQLYYWYITHFPNYKDIIYEHYDKKRV
ncbi:Baeyer-Villiger monooxygenase [Candida parapsilosis]|nr:Baeyer-Villiger monooxygenase [Candida parapsilosis]